jgi:N-acyl-D-aspartate/D-glutamate deacylase
MTGREVSVLDFLVSNARIVDGSGGASRMADLGVKDGRIAAIGKLRERARRTIDADGRVLTPGFVDVHTHYDAQMFWDPVLSPSTLHGVTSVVAGNCGFSIAPLSPRMTPYLRGMLARVEGMPAQSLELGAPWDWESFGDYIARFENRIGPNIGVLCGHSALRLAAMGERALDGKATPDELERMKKLLAISIREGALGFSSTMSPSHNDAKGRPVPSRHASREELIGLAGVCRDYPGTLLGFIPGLDKWSEHELSLMTEMSLAAQRHLNWNVLLIRPGNSDFIAHQLTAADYAKRNGATVVGLAMVVPPTLRVNLRNGFLLDVFEGWTELFELSIPERMEALRDPERRVALARGAEANVGVNGFLDDWGAYVVTDSRNKALNGQRIDDLARRFGKSVFDTFLDIALADDLATVFLAPTAVDDKAMWQRRADLWRDRRTVVGASDAGAHLDMIDAFTFATTMLSAARDHGLLSLEECVHRLSYRPATLVGLKDRGLLKEGWRADMVMLDPDTVAPAPTQVRHDLPGEQIRLYADAVGIEHVIVNGTCLVERGEYTGALPGVALRPGRDTETRTFPN